MIIRILVELDMDADRIAVECPPDWTHENYVIDRVRSAIRYDMHGLVSDITHVGVTS